MCTMTSFKGPKIQVLKHHILYMFTLKISIGSIIFLFAEQILKYLQSTEWMCCKASSFICIPNYLQKCIVAHKTESF